jgi:hypothetical protein
MNTESHTDIVSKLASQIAKKIRCRYKHRKTNSLMRPNNTDLLTPNERKRFFTEIYIQWDREGEFDNGVAPEIRALRNLYPQEGEDIHTILHCRATKILEFLEKPQ